VSHGLLLLRSGISDEHPTRIDILFQDVQWMSLPVSFNGLEIEAISLDSEIAAIPKTVYQINEGRTLFRLISKGFESYVLSSETVGISKDERHYHEDSQLLANPS